MVKHIARLAAVFMFALVAAVAAPASANADDVIGDQSITWG